MRRGVAAPACRQLTSWLAAESSYATSLRSFRFFDLPPPFPCMRLAMVCSVLAINQVPASSSQLPAIGFQGKDCMQDFKCLKVWQEARRLTRSVYELTSEFPQAEEFGLKSQIRRSAISVCSNIAEGSGRRGDREFGRFLDVALGSICELECELILANDLELLSDRDVNAIVAALVVVRRMLSGLRRQLGVPQPRTANRTRLEERAGG